MERDVGCELWRSAPEAGVKFSTYVENYDSATLADILAKVPYDGLTRTSQIIIY